MKTPKNAFFRWFSFNRHRRRAGARAVMNDIGQADFEQMRQRVIESDGEPSVPSGQAAKQLPTHLRDLRHQFHGQSELAYHHAVLIVLIRREVDVQKNYRHFRQLWDQHADFLAGQLDLRWLISACDTFIDHDDDDLVRCLMMSAVLLVNTVKLQETERLIETDQTHRIDPAALASLHTGQRLFDGLSPFAVGNDDTLRNMRWRLDRLCRLHPLGMLALTVFERLQQSDHPNVYSRFRQLPMKENTQWWQ